MRALLSLLLVLPGTLAVQTDPCLVVSHEEREQAGFGVVYDERLCTERSGARHTEHVRVTQGPPSDNRSVVLVAATYEHDRSGDRSGAHAIREHAELRSGGTTVAAWYNSTRSSAGFTTCSLALDVAQPRGAFAFRSPLPLCVPQELLQP